MKNVIANTRIGFKYVVPLFAKERSILVNDRTRIVIEGFPRSANTFFVAAFTYMQGEEICIARHRHELGQILEGVWKKLPVVVIVRYPVDAIASFIVRESVTIEFAIKYYVQYYSRIKDLGDKLVVADFEEIITNPANVVERVNKRFGVGFRHFPLALEDEEAIKGLVEKMELLDSGEEMPRPTHIAYPTRNGREKKAELARSIASRHPKLVEKATRLYEDLSGRS